VMHITEVLRGGYIFGLGGVGFVFIDKVNGRVIFVLELAFQNQFAFFTMLPTFSIPIWV